MNTLRNTLQSKDGELRQLQDRSSQLEADLRSKEEKFQKALQNAGSGSGGGGLSSDLAGDEIAQELAKVKMEYSLKRAEFESEKMELKNKIKALMDANRDLEANNLTQKRLLHDLQGNKKSFFSF